MEFELGQAREVLQRTPGVLSSMLAGLSDPWVTSNYGDETFSPFDVVGHLIHADRADWMPRLQIILQHGESVPFEPFDRYAMYDASRGKSIDELLAEFAEVRHESLETLSSIGLAAEQLEQTGTHPALGRVTARQLLATWVAHDLNHIHQIAKPMAFQYRDAVGPWRAHLGVLPKN